MEINLNQKKKRGMEINHICGGMRILVNLTTIRTFIPLKMFIPILLPFRIVECDPILIFQKCLLVSFLFHLVLFHPTKHVLVLIGPEKKN